MATERIMADVTSVEGGGSPGVSSSAGSQQNIESTTLPQSAGLAEAEGQTLLQPPDEQNPQRPWYISRGFDPKRVGEYSVKEEGGYRVFTDPKTGEEVARILQIAGGDGENSSRGPEAYQPPEGFRDPESKTSPEYGRWLAEQIIEMRTTMSYEQRYSGENGRRLKWLYDSLQEHVDAVCAERNERDPWDRLVRDVEGNLVRDAEGHTQTKVFAESPLLLTKDENGVYHLEKPPRPTGRETRPPESIDLASLPSSLLDELAVRFSNLSNASPEEAKNVLEELSKYFKQADSLGLLKGVNTVLRSIRDDVLSGEDEAQVVDVMERKFEQARRVARERFRRLSRGRPEFNRLNGVWELYIALAEERFLDVLEGEPQREYEPGEFRLDQQAEEERETYWEVGNYPKYYLVTAKTPEQFLIAKESFLRMIRSGTLAKSAEALYEHVNNFKDMFGTQGSRQVKKGTVTEEFIRDQRVELEGQLLVFVIDYATESYNPKLSKDASTAMAKDEGPERWCRLFRTGNGQVAAFTHMFDKEAIMEIFNNPTGERGELDIIAGHFLQDQIKEIVIGKGMGITLKTYNPEDEDLNSNLPSGDRIARFAALERIQAEIRGGRRVSDLSDTEKEIYGAFRSNLERLGLHQPDEDFRSLYEGFDNGDAHMLDFLRYGQLSDDQLERLPDSLKEFVNRNRVQLTEDQLKELPKGLRDSVELGRIQVEVQAIREEIRSGAIKTRKTAAEILAEILKERDPKAYELYYKAAYDQAKANFDVAFQMQGALGEKARRGRGFLYVDRNDDIRYYFEVWDEFRLQRKNIDDPVQLDNFRRTLPEDKRKSFDIGRMLSRMRDGRELNNFSQEEQGLGEADYVDNIPVYQAENFVQWAVNRTKMEYADAPAEVRQQKAEEARVKAIDELHKNGFAAQLWDDFILRRDSKPVALNNIGYDRYGKPVSLSFNEEGIPVGIEFDNEGAVVFDKPEARDRQRVKFDNLDKNTKFLPKLMTFKRPLGIIDSKTGQFRKFKNDEVLGYNEAGQEIKLSFDQEGKPQGLEFDQDGKAIIYDKAGDGRSRIIYDNINVSTRARLHAQTGIFVEEAAATFQIAAQSDDFRNRYSSHTYWFYQGNNRHTILAPRIFEAAKRIKDGLSRPEDEDILATQLLIIDPTLKRVRRFKKVDQQREITLVAAAVEESYQGRQTTKRELHQKFLPKDGYRGRMRAGYDNEDWAGMQRFTLGFEEFAASQPGRFARRLGAEIAIAPFEHDAAGSLWGVHGVSGAVSVMADEIKKFSHQGIVGQFGLTKFIDEMDNAVQIYNALVGYTDPQTGEHVFGLLEKPTDNNEQLHQFFDKIDDILNYPQHQIPFLYEFLKTFGRLQRVIKLMRSTYTNTRNSGGALNLEKVEVFNSDGSFNTAIETDKTIANDVGTARHSQEKFFRAFVDWLLSTEPGGGGDVYPDELFWNKFLRNNRVIATGKEGEDARKIIAETFADWVLSKIA